MAVGDRAFHKWITNFFVSILFSPLIYRHSQQVARKLAMVEADLERAEERAETGES